MKDYFKTLLGKNNQTPPSEKIDEAREWFRTKAFEVERLSTTDVIRNATELYTNRLILGHFYLFRYDPKYKNELPYYDRFPTILLLDRSRDSFTGLNLHYLPYSFRAGLMDQLHQYVTGQDELARVRVTYNILKTTARLRFYRPCLKQYLNNHIRSRLVHIGINEWDISLFLPLQRFIKKNEQKVHRDSIRTIRNYR